MEWAKKFLMLLTMNKKWLNYNNSNDGLKKIDNVYGKMSVIYCVVDIWSCPMTHWLEIHNFDLIN